jgi:hypothetical protein
VDIRYCFVCGAEGVCPHREELLLPLVDRLTLAAKLEKLTAYPPPRPPERVKDLVVEEVKRYKRVSACAKVGWAIRNGTLVRPGRCEDCGTRCFPDAHHEDYDRPLEVEWLCKKCHRLRDTTGRRRRRWKKVG